MTAKRKRRESAGLPLFDLPLQSGAEARDPGSSSEDGEAPPANRGPSVLYDGGEDAAQDEAPGSPTSRRHPEAQLELTEPEAAPDDAPQGHSKLYAARSAEQLELIEPEEKASDAALLGDRLLGGLADFAVQLLMLGLAIAATHALGVAVSPADWMPFAVLALVFSFLYCAVPLAFWGQTPGMAWVGHTARGADGEPLTFSQTFRRWLGALLTLAFAGLPLLLALTGRSLTDRLSGSQTVAQ